MAQYTILEFLYVLTTPCVHVFVKPTCHNSGLPTPSRFRFPPFALYTTNGRYRIVHPVGMRWYGHVLGPGGVIRFTESQCTVSSAIGLQNLNLTPTNSATCFQAVGTTTEVRSHTHTPFPHKNSTPTIHFYTLKQGTAYLFEAGNFVWPGVKPGRTRVVSGGYP